MSWYIGYYVACGGEEGVTFYFLFFFSCQNAAVPVTDATRPFFFVDRSSAVAEGAVMSATEAPDAAEVPDVDASRPSTTLQIRLHDGRRVRAQLNMHHTVRHVQAIIAR